MSTVTGFTAERMLNIENSTVVDGEVQGDNLILLTRDGTPIDAGSVRGPKGDTGAIGEPVQAGIISMYGGTTAPAGYLICDGRLVSRVTYANLFAAIGTTWGAGDGLNDFGIPNIQERFPVGKGTAAWATPLTKADGSKDDVLVQHQHDIGHTHNTSNHRHGFDHGHTASSGYESTDHYHQLPPHGHPYSGLNAGGVGFAYRSPVAAGSGDGYDIANGNPERNVQLKWMESPTVADTGWINTSAQLQWFGGNRNTHGHAISVANTSGAVTTDAGAQTLTHTGSTTQIGVPGTDKNLPPYVVVNFIIKT